MAASSFAELSRYGKVYSGGKVAIVCDGSHAVCACDESLTVLDLVSGKQRLSVQSPTDEFTAFALHPSRHEMVTASRSRQLQHWQLDLTLGKSESVRSWKAHKMPVIDLAYEATGTLVASASADSTVMVFDVAKGYCTHVFRGHSGVVHRVLFHHDPAKLQLFSSGADNVVRVWDLASRACVAQLSEHTGLPAALALSADGATLITGGRDQVVNLWDVSSGKLLKSTTVLEPVEAVVVLGEARGGSKGKKGSRPLRFVTAGGGGTLRSWDGASSTCVQRQEAAAAALPALTHLLPFGDGEGKQQRLLAVTEDHNLLIHEASSLQLERCIVGYNDEITDLKYVSQPSASAIASAQATAEADAAAAATPGSVVDERRTQLAVATNSEQIRLFEVHSMSCRLLSGHTDIVLALDVSADGHWIGSASKDLCARVWDAVTAKCVAKCAGHVEAVGAVAFGRRGAFLLTGSKDKTLKLWDLKPLAACRASGKYEKELSPRALSTVLAHSKDINTLAVAPNDRLVITGSQDRTLKVWGAADGAVATGMLPLPGVLKEVATLSGHRRGVWAAAFSPVDKVAASASGDMTIKVWSMSSFSCLRTLEGHSASTLKVLFIAGGTQLVSSGSDGLLKLWSLKTNECLCTLDGHEDKVWALDAYERDGAVELLSGSSDSSIVRWRDRTQEEQQTAAIETETRLQQEEVLANAMATKQFGAALDAALQLRQPRALRKVVEALEETQAGDAKLRAAVGALDEEGLLHCLQCARTWNTTAAHSLTAHRMLHAVLRSRSAEAVAALPAAKELLEALLPYSQRHFERLDRLLLSSHFVTYTLTAMRMLLPPGDAAAAADGASMMQGAAPSSAVASHAAAPDTAPSALDALLSRAAEAAGADGHPDSSAHGDLLNGGDANGVHVDSGADADEELDDADGEQEANAGSADGAEMDVEVVKTALGGSRWEDDDAALPLVRGPKKEVRKAKTTPQPAKGQKRSRASVLSAAKQLESSTSTLPKAKKMKPGPFSLLASESNAPPTAPATSTPKASAKTTPETSAIATPTSSATLTSKALTKFTPKASAKSTPNASAKSKSTPKASAKSTPNASAKSTPKASAKSTPKASAKSTPKASAKSTPKALATSTPKAARKPVTSVSAKSKIKHGAMTKSTAVSTPKASARLTSKAKLKS